MFLDGKQGCSLTADAVLEYFVDTRAAVGCQMSFWYHIHEENSATSSSSIRVNLVRGTATETKLLKTPASSADEWQNARTVIGNRPAKYKLQFAFSCPFLKPTDVMLDDISFEKCAEGDIPAGPQQLSCDFEEDTCSWYHDYTASMLWERKTGGFQHHPEGNGYYMLISSKSGLNISSRARLVGFTVGPVICVSFHYHIFGNSIGSLKFIVKYSGEAETIVWMRSGTQGNKWRFADLTFTSDTPIQFIIEAVVGGKQGTICIDDLVVSNSGGSCPAERECTFQGSLCGLQPVPSADYSWQRATGASRPANSSGPGTDHTLETDHGYYLSAELWRHRPGSRVKIATGLMEPTPPHGECLMFWFYMEGRAVGELNVHLQAAGAPVRLWSRSGDQGSHWRHGRVSLLNPDSSYQVVFEAVTGEGPRRDIAIDDLTVLNGVCPPEGFCDFEIDLCGWVNNRPADSGIDWDWLSGKSEGSLVPERDHSTMSSLGHFVFYRLSGSDRGQKAQLESESMEAVEQACLEFWHYANGWTSNKPSDITLTVFVNETSGLRPIWSMNGYLNNTWIQSKVDYSASGPHQIILQANNTVSSISDSSFSLDDVHIIRNKSCLDTIPTTTPNPATTTTTTTPPNPGMHCTFEQDLCNWVQEVDDDFNWTLSRGLQVDELWNGPLYDHTEENNQGFYLLLNGSAFKGGEKASISLPLNDGTSQVCVGFWYYMLGPSVSAIDLLVKTNSSEMLIWTRKGSQNPEWIQAQVTIDVKDEMTRVMFTGHRSSTSEGFIALDDVTVSIGDCREDSPICGFESGWCGFERDVSHQGHWGRERGTKNNVDHTFGTENGYYMTVTKSNSTQQSVAQLLSPDFISPSEMCVRFWYRLPVGSANKLSVHVRSEEVGGALWQHSGAVSSDWEVAEVTVFWPTKFNVVFRASHEPGSNSTVQIDDFSVRNEACSPSANCDFDSGQCNWLNLPTENGYDWVLASTGFRGLPVRHTTSEGCFLLSTSQHRNISVAQIASEWIHLKDPNACLTLSYHVDNSLGTMRVHVRSVPSEDELIFQSSSGHTWDFFSQTLEQKKPFQLVIQAETSHGGFVAIDDISLTPGPCQANETSSGFAGCTFENGTCGWKDVSVGQGQWEIMVGEDAPVNTGPSVDHTLGTALGGYVALTPNKGEHISPATLQSPVMTQASATCTFHFYYNMYGEDIQALKVLRSERSRTTVLWWRSGGGDDVWQRGEVAVARPSQDFTILLQATRAFSQLGHVAVDDMAFTTCPLPEPQPVCADDKFACNNSVCVEKSRVCDFTDDCGDRTDELDCENQGVTQRCSFEQGLCSWARNQLDEGGERWRRQKGQDAWPAGPPLDHTLNNAAGHYLTPGTPGISEVLSNTLLPSSNCTIRFFYYSLGDATGRLTAQSRTLRSGGGDTVLWLAVHTPSYSWQRTSVTFSSSVKCKIVFRYEGGNAGGGHVALDDVSFSEECAFDPANGRLPDTSPTSAPTTSTSTPTSTSASTPAMSPSPTNPCQEDEFFCWRSSGQICIAATLKCNYLPDCSQGEDEDGCGPCTFERDQCGWTNAGQAPRRWHRLRAGGGTQPPTDHTTHSGFFMSVNSSQASGLSEARLQSPTLPPSSPYCQIQFHFHISSECAGSLKVLTQQDDGSEAILWSRNRRTARHWTPEFVPLWTHLQPHKVWLSSWGRAYLGEAASEACVVAVDDISFLNCENFFQPPALPAFRCTFEDSLCDWLQGADDDLDWTIRSGPTDTPNTGPAGDHTTGTGNYLYIESSHPSAKGDVAQLKSALLPPAGEQGYCLTFWYHMFGATVGSLRMFLHTAVNKSLVWQRSGDQGDEWRAAQSHVTLQRVHQVIVEASVGGEAGDIAVDDVSLVPGTCPTSDVCDFEEGSCNWQQDNNDDADWIGQSGSTPNPNTGPDSDHTTNTPMGHYYYLPSSNNDIAGQTAAMSSPLYPPTARQGACVKIWYHMYGRGVGTFNVYQESQGGVRALIFSQSGDQLPLWRLAEASLLPSVQPYKLVVEGVKGGPTLEGDMAFDDVHLIDTNCPPHGTCDFEMDMCSWTNVRGSIDQGDWLRGMGASPNPNTGPSVDHTTHTPHGSYLYVDSSVGQRGDASFIISDVLQPATRGHCLEFWYHMFGPHVGTLRVYVNDRKTQASGNEAGVQTWVEIGNKGDKWLKANVFVEADEAFWFAFAYHRSEEAGGDVALDDINIFHGSCDPEPTIDPVDDYTDMLSIGLAVGLTLLAGVVIVFFLIRLNRERCAKSQADAASNNVLDQDAVFDLYDCQIDGTQRGSVSNVSFYNNLYEPSTNASNTRVDSSSA
ncbi:MAM and LDL-receptor class A domain-containing protein 1 isoform X1 [Entelurus aequoreus]|uniref:MAM and LDL-receptor class A domain-containing protein 1 isoform X1 n=2 Tax=Entelurus aequoreus TaxID=161455 RepID=UPI002B1DC958|nr:MAM and LDL-receptor class A domain-containing protein 1 isoform X1 [Entelurus aequoreus]XP_061879773.1 MAM and LDL-receptor class A domain-containing protein 1 isoform X1 [Entelurus aequoreus]